MIKSIKAGERYINLKASAAALIIYKQQFGKEYTQDYQDAQSGKGAAQTGYQLVWSLAKCADNSIPDPEIWLKTLGKDFDIAQAVKTAAELIYESMGEFAEDKGDSEEDTDNSNLSERIAAVALRCGFTIADMNEVSISFLIRCVNEHIDIVSGGKSGKKNNVNKSVRTADSTDISSLVSKLTGGRV